jgi:hypothetical protein
MILDIKAYLDEHAKRINHPSFIENDPVQFPRRYKRLQDIEIVSFLVAWGLNLILRYWKNNLAIRK